jgi:hypothetical protein
MDSTFVAEAVRLYKERYGLEVHDSQGLFRAQRQILEFVVGVGRELEQRVFAEIGKGYEGARIQREGKEYRFVGYRGNRVQGLFGQIRYQRAYYACATGGTRIPLDEQLGIEKQHTPAMQYFLASFTGRDPYGESLGRFHEIFRPEGRDLVSMRKALDMDYELGERLEQRRQQEISDVFEGQKPMETERLIEGTMAVSIDATKVREKMGESTTADGRTRYEIGFRDAKIAAVSEVGWDSRRKEAHCRDSSYVSGIEHADEFFRRVWVEMIRRCREPTRMRIVFLADGAEWIWDRIPTIANADSLCILDFYHACEHLAELCKDLYGEGTAESGKRFQRWRKKFLDGQVAAFLRELKGIRDEQTGAKRDIVQGHMNYFSTNKDRMHYDRYIAMRLPIGSGTIESACKNVIGARMKRSGMTWSPPGADGMLQIRASLASNRLLADFQATLAQAA